MNTKISGNPFILFCRMVAVMNVLIHVSTLKQVKKFLTVIYCVAYIEAYNILAFVRTVVSGFDGFPGLVAQLIIDFRAGLFSETVPFIRACRSRNVFHCIPVLPQPIHAPMSLGHALG